MKTVLAVLLFIGSFIAGSNAAVAQCACIHPNITALEEFDKSEVVFIGEVVDSKVVEKPAYPNREDTYDMEVKFKVKKVWRKSLQEEVSVRFLVFGCIATFEKGTEHLVYAVKDDKGRLRMGCCCTRSRPLEKAGEDIKEFEKRGEEQKQVIKQ